jgi:GNAT superfamily N-acetyltransferase
MGKIEVRPLRPEDDRTQFHSGNADLDRFFARYAGQNQFRHHIGTTYVAHDGEAIVGFVTVSASHIEIDRLSAVRKRNLPHYPLPVLRLARLAVADSARGQGVGLELLHAVFHLAREMAERVGCVGVVVDAKPDAVRFYERYGFEAIEALEGTLGARPQPVAMFLPLGAIPKIR